MLSYEPFFIIILISLLGPVLGLFLIIFYNLMEQKVYLLEMENRRIYLEKELQKSEYVQLTQQIHPHFLFNALNSLLSLARLKRFDQLVESFEHLVRFLRYKYQVKKQLHPFYLEMDHTRHYLAIQAMRFGERLQVQWEIDPQLGKAVIPPYLLQTLVENSFKHGLETIEEQALLYVELSRIQENQREWVQLKVQDNGPGFQFDPLLGDSPNQGEPRLGLRNIEKRLQLLFPNQAEIRFVCRSCESESPGGVVQVTSCKGAPHKNEPNKSELHKAA